MHQKYTKVFQCVDCTNSIIKQLKNKNISREIIELKSPYPNIWSDKLNTNISTKGYHKAVIIKGKVFDNIYPDGILYDDWIKAFEAPYNSLNVNKKMY